MKRIIFHDPRLASTTGGGESLTLRKIAALDHDRFRATILTKKCISSPLLIEFRQHYPHVDIVTLDVLDDPSDRGMNEFVKRHGGAGLWGRDLLVDDGIRFNRVAADYYHNTEYDLVSFSFLTDLFALDIQASAVFHIYGRLPADMADDEAPLLEKVSRISAVSEFIRDAFYSVLPQDTGSDSVEVVSPGLPPAFTEPLTARSRDADFVFAGRLVPRKGVDLIIYALEILKTRYGLQPSVVIAGNGPLRNKLPELCRQLGVEKQVKFTGTLNQGQLIELLDRARWFLYPVRKPEAFGMSPLEAMARGVPAIVGVPGGMSEYLREQENGYIMDRCDAGALAALMCKVCKTGLCREQLSRNCLGTAGRYSWDAFCSKVNRFFLDAVA